MTPTDFPVPIISVTACGPQAPGVCPHDTSVKYGGVVFSGETEVHSGKTLPQGHRGKSVICEGKTLTSSWPRF